MSKDEVTETSKQEMKILATTAQQMTVNDNAMNITLLYDVASLLEEMMANDLVFSDITKTSPDFNFNYADAIGNLISYTTTNS